MTDAAAEESKYAEATDELARFIENFRAEDANGDPTFKYMNMLQEVADRKRKTVFIELDDVHESIGAEMAESIRKNTPRYLQILGDAIDRHMPDSSDGAAEPDVADVLMGSRRGVLRVA